MATEAKAPPEILKGLKGIRNIFILSVASVIVVLLGYIYLFTPVVPSAWFIGGIWFVILNELLARVDRRFRVSPAALVLFMFPMMMFGSKSWWANGGPETNYQNFTDVITMTLVGLPTSSPQDYAILTTYIPSWLLPNDLGALSMAWTGLAPGMSIPWGIWIGPIIAWSFLALTNYAYSLFFVFSFIGPHWDERERLLFPMSIPTVYSVNESAGSRDPSSGKSRLFDWRNSTSKAFWIAFIIGTLLSSISVLASLGALVRPPWICCFSQFRFNSGNVLTEGILPGAGFDGVFLPTMVMIYVILPYDVSVTVILTWFIFRVLYDMSMIRLGYVAFTPGANEWTYGVIGPIPWVTWGYTGLTIGYAMWLWWAAKSRIISGIRSLSKGPNPDEGGITMRSKFIGLIVTTILFLMGSIMAGVNWLIAIVMLFLYTGTLTVFGRTFSELYIFGPTNMYYQWQYTQPVGQLIGVYGPAPSITGPKVAEALQATVVPGLSKCAGLGGGGVGIAGMCTTYKVLRDTKTNMKDAIKWILIVGVIATPLALAFNIYLSYHLGGSNLASSWYPGGCIDPQIFGQGVTSNSWNPNAIMDNMWLWTLYGIIVMFVMGYLRMRYTWFFINPMAFMIQLTGSPYFPWLNAVIALPLKYILVRALGPVRTEKYIIPIFAGFSLGSVSLFFVESGWIFATVGIQRAISMWH